MEPLPALPMASHQTYSLSQKRPSGLSSNFQSQPVSKTGLGCVGFAENCIVLAEGRMQMNKTFRVQALGFPPLEQRQDTEAAAKVPVNSLNPVHASPSKLVNCSPCLACRLECPSARSGAYCARAWYCVAQEHQH